MANILIIEDDKQISEVIAAYLKRKGHQSMLEYSGMDGQRALHENEFQLVILDLMLPDMSGEDVCSAIRSKSRVPILMLTAKADEASLIYGFRLGADDYMIKPFSPRELMVRIEALLRRSHSGPVAELLELDEGRLLFDSGKRRVSRDGEVLSLTAVEFDVLEKLISYPGRIFSREEILKAVRGDEFQGTDRTVDSHIRNLRSKIEETPKTPRYIMTERGKGFYFNG